MFEAFGEEIWISSGPEVESFGFRYPTRMAVIRLEGGTLFVWSPVALTDELKAAVDALGVVRFIVTPTAMHSAALTAWKAAYPRAALYAAPGSRKRAKDVLFDADLDDAAPAAWAGRIDQVIVRGNLIAEEAVLFHRKSGVVLIADLLQNFPRGWFQGFQALIARMDGMIGEEAQTPRKFRAAFIQRKAARAAVRIVLDWPAEKVAMAHGTPVRADGKAFLRQAFRWLIR